MTHLFGSKFSRRSLFSRKISNVVALALVPALLQACGTPEAEQAGTNQTAAGKGARKSSADSKASKRKITDADETADYTALDSSQQGVTTTQQQGQTSTTTTNTVAQPSASTQLAPSTTVNPKVTGAKPDNGFFARGAPTLSLAQISAGQQIAGKCEGGLHDLVIEPQHLQALAQGQSVTIKSSTHTHFANPTVHNHSVTYTPIMG